MVSPTRSLRFAFSKLRGNLALKRSGARLGHNPTAFGVPIVAVFPGSRIEIGDDVLLISDGFATALGVNHPVVLRTLAEHAALIIGSRVGISGGSICASVLVEIGDDTLLGANVTIVDTDFHSLAPALGRCTADGSIQSAPVTIGKNVFIGTNSIVLKGVSIGENSVVGAGSVVSKDIPPNSIAAGNPCKLIRQLNLEELTAAKVPASSLMSPALQFGRLDGVSEVAS